MVSTICPAPANESFTYNLINHWSSPQAHVYRCSLLPIIRFAESSSACSLEYPRADTVSPDLVNQPKDWPTLHDHCSSILLAYLNTVKCAYIPMLAECIGTLTLPSGISRKGVVVPAPAQNLIFLVRCFEARDLCKLHFRLEQ